MNLLAEQIKIEALAYWKFIRQHQFGAIECWDNDVMTVSKSLMITDTEVKTSIGDMQREVKTKFYKHRRIRERSNNRNLQPFSHYFYFAVPETLVEKALEVCDERYPYAGLLVFKGLSLDPFKPIMECVRPAKRAKREKATLEEVRRIAYIASNNIIKYANKGLNDKEVQES